MLSDAPGEWCFRPQGPGRVARAGFLLVWVCGWAVGEAFALYLILTGLWALLSGTPPPGRHHPLEPGSSLAVGGFLLIWLTFWTIGGVVAIREILRALWAEDRIAVEQDGLTLTRRLGPFVTRQQLRRADLRHFYLQPSRSSLVAQVGNRTLTLTRLGTLEERTRAAEQLRSAMKLPTDPAITAGRLPVGWQEITELRGGVVIAPDPHTRRKQAHVVAVLTGVVWSVALLLIRGSLQNPTLWGLTAIVAVLGLWLIRQTLWMYRGRREWRIERGRLVHQRRYGYEVTELAEAREMELTEEAGSHGDRRYTLAALLADQADQKPGARVPILKTIHDPTEPRHLGLWLSERAAVPFRDLVPTDADRQAEWARLTDALAGTGKLGQWLSKRIRLPPKP